MGNTVTVPSSSPNTRMNRLWECGNLAFCARFPSACGNRSVVSIGAAFPQLSAPCGECRKMPGCCTWHLPLVFLLPTRWFLIGPSSGAVRVSLDRPRPSVRLPRRRKAPGLSIDAAQFHVHEADEPIAALGFGEPDQFAPHRFAHKDPFPLPLDLPRRFHAPHLVGRVVPRILEPRGIGPGRRHIVARGWRLPERFMRPLRVEFPPHAIKPPLLLRAAWPLAAWSSLAAA